MPVVALIIDHFADDVDLRYSIMGNVPFWQQILIGSVGGLAAGFLARWLAGTKWMSKASATYGSMLEGIEFNQSDVWLISVCAGVGEELLFRGAVQPLIGIVPAAILFVAIHGYLNPSKGRVVVYGLVMTVIICGAGWLGKTYGLLVPIIIHTLIDVVLLNALLKEHRLADRVTEDSTFEQ